MPGLKNKHLSTISSDIVRLTQNTAGRGYIVFRIINEGTAINKENDHIVIYINPWSLFLLLISSAIRLIFVTAKQKPII